MSPGRRATLRGCPTRRRAGPSDVAVSFAGMPSDWGMAACAAAGVTWVLAAGWVDELGDLIALAATGVDG